MEATGIYHESLYNFLDSNGYKTIILYPSGNFIIPKVFDPKVAKNIVLKVAKVAVKSGVARIYLNNLQIEKIIDLNLKRNVKGYE